MKHIAILFAAVVALICSCQNSPGPVEETPKKPISVSVLDLKSKMTSISMNLNAMGVYLDFYDRWGIVYSESSDMEEGVEVLASGVPSDGMTSVEVEELQPDTKYYVWGWAEGDEVGRLWTSYYQEIRTKKENDPVKLSGRIIGTEYSVDYDTGEKSLIVNNKANVFDGDYETFFASYDRSGTWVGMDLGTKHLIRKVGYSPRIGQEGRVELAVIEGANEPDFSDALPIHVIKNSAPSSMMTYDDITCSRGFRYVRYMSPNDVRCNLAELEFYGLEGEGDDSKLFQVTNLPSVIINTENAEEITSKEYELSSNVYIISENGTNLLATSETGVRGRGNASWLYFDKKPYRLKFASKQSPLGAPASAKKWTLISNYGDKTLMRNILAFEVSRAVGQAYTPFCHPVDLFVNGEYRGCYQLCDQVEAAKDRVNAKDGYLIEVDGYAYQETSNFWSWRGTPVTIKHPDEDDITIQQKDHIAYFFSMMEAAAMAENFADPVNGYRKYLDLDSFLRNFIIGDFCGNTDMFWSVYMYKDIENGPLFTGPTWDHDLSFNNDYRSYPVNDSDDFLLFTKSQPAGDALTEVARRIIKEDPQAKERLIELWEHAYENGGLKNLKEYADKTAQLLQESQELNFKRWKILDHQVHMNFQALGSYEAEVEFVKTYIDERLILFDKLVRQ